MKKILFFLITLVFLFKPGFIWAADLEVDCYLSGCIKSIATPLFSQPADGYWYPGRQLAKSILLTNHTAFPLIINLSAPRSGPVSILEDVFNATLSGNTTIYDGNLTNFYQTPSFNLGILGSGSTTIYSLAFAFDQNAGNDYQNKNSVFDLNLNFTEDISVVNPSPTPTSAPSAGGSVNGVSTAYFSPPTCNDAAPGGAPTLLSVIPGINSVTLNWSEGIGPISYYLIAYGTTPGVYQYGNPNIGGPGTTAYTVGSLSPGQTYYFVIRAGNGCTPGPFSKELAGGPLAGGAIIPAGVIPAGFAPNVLGTQTTGGSPEVLGSTANSCQKHWLPLLFIIAFFINLIILARIPVLGIKLILPLIPSILALVIDNYFLRGSCCLLPAWFCHYFWVGNVFSYLLPLFLSLRSK